MFLFVYGSCGLRHDALPPTRDDCGCQLAALQGAVLPDTCVEIKICPRKHVIPDDWARTGQCTKVVCSQNSARGLCGRVWSRHRVCEMAGKAAIGQFGRHRAPPVYGIALNRWRPLQCSLFLFTTVSSVMASLIRLSSLRHLCHVVLATVAPSLSLDVGDSGALILWWPTPVQ